MANVTRYTPFEDLFNEFTRGFFVKPLAMPGGAEMSIKLDVKEDDKTAAAKKVGAAIAKAAIAKGIEAVVFDRNGFDYHGRVEAVAAAAREAGLKF